jgi:hypothetical protein
MIFELMSDVGRHDLMGLKTGPHNASAGSHGIYGGQRCKDSVLGLLEITHDFIKNFRCQTPSLLGGKLREREQTFINTVYRCDELGDEGDSSCEALRGDVMRRHGLGVASQLRRNVRRDSSVKDIHLGNDELLHSSPPRTSIPCES